MQDIPDRLSCLFWGVRFLTRSASPQSVVGPVGASSTTYSEADGSGRVTIARSQCWGKATHG